MSKRLFLTFIFIGIVGMGVKAYGHLNQDAVLSDSDVVHYTGKTIARPARHDGGLKPVVGVHSIQTMRAEMPWTYNHQPMMAWWNNRFYMHYLSDPRHEHEPPGKTLLQTSSDGYTWSDPVELFPEYPGPDGFTKETQPGIVAKDLKAIMHQRVGFLCSTQRQIDSHRQLRHRPHPQGRPQ